MECLKADALFKHFIRATKAHVVATEILANLIGSRERFAEARLHVEKTYAECKAAQSALETHRQHHNCAASWLEGATPSDEHPH